MTKTVLITGASSGFGEATARLFAEKNYALVLLARRRERLQALKQQLQHKTAVHCITADICDLDALREALGTIPEPFKGIDILVNNAGLALGLEAADKTDFSDWQTMVNTNVTGLLAVTHYFLPGMVARNRGHIINIASTAGSWPYPGGNTYGASKAFVQQFSRGLRCDLLGSQIRVTTLSPGMAETEFSDVRFKQDKAKADAVYKNTQPLLAEDIAQIIDWVTSVPAHVNINEMEIMPVCQAWGPLAVYRDD